MGRVVAMLVAAVCVASAGCGSSEEGPEAARHLDPRSDVVIAVDLDYESGNWEQIKRLYARAIQEGGLEDGGPLTPATLDGGLETLASSAGLSFSDDIRPLLGGTLQIGVRVEPAEPLSASARDMLERLDLDATRWERDGPRYFGYDGEPLERLAVEEALRQRRERRPEMSYTAVYTVQDADALERVLDKLRGQGLESRAIEGNEDARRLARGVAVVGGDTIVAALDDDGSSDALLRDRLEATGDGPALPDLGEDLLALRVSPTLLGAWLDREELRRALDTDAGRALRGAELRLALEQDAARASARVDFEGLAEDELPLPGPGPLALPTGEPVASASADQSLTTVFLARLARELFPDSRFVRRVERLEAREGLRFEDEVLRQFSGPSFSVLRLGPDGGVGFGARSTLRDPAAMRALLERIAPDLPGILEGLQGLGASGLTTLLLVAPDAPLTPGAFGLLAAVDVRRLAGDGSEQLYEVTGLDEQDARAGPNRVVYGLVGDAFVVASSPELAREVAGLSTEQAREAATRARVDVGGLLEGAEAWLGDDSARALRALVESAEASASAEGGDVVGEAELRWAR